MGNLQRVIPRNVTTNKNNDDTLLYIFLSIFYIFIFTVLIKIKFIYKQYSVYIFIIDTIIEDIVHTILFVYTCVFVNVKRFLRPSCESLEWHCRRWQRRIIFYIHIYIYILSMYMYMYLI